ncbi:MAG: radical SAM protein [Deltaproteobacteria bacterium]|nr:radical SAM protein [Deltaproteobacteria bacterium]
MRREALRELIRQRLRLERGRVDKSAPFTVALAYPSPYRVGMSSLGYLQIYKTIQAEPEMACERVFLHDDAGSGPVTEPPLSYEGLRALDTFPVIAFSVAYELELAGVVQMLAATGIPALREERDERHPIVIAGGPLTFSNPLPLAAFVDAVVMGEADSLAVEVLRVLREAPSRGEALRTLAAMPHVFVPEHHGDRMPAVAQCDDALLPAWSPIRTPDTELSDMFLIETERGCSRGCTYCVMRRTTNGGMRVVPMTRVLELIPEDATRVGLVGAAVSDHPEIVPIVETLVARGAQVGLSSLRPDRLKDRFVGALKSAGYKTLTTAMDGASDRVREILDRRARTNHLEHAAEMARLHGIHRLKLYLMLGVPGETDEDVDECAAFVSKLSKIIPVALTIAPFCAKRNTPLDGQPFAGIAVVDRRLDRLRRGLKGRADVRATSARWAWVEYVLAQGGVPEALALRQAVHAGGRFADYRKAFDARQVKTARTRLFIVKSEAGEGRRHTRWLEPSAEST